MYERVRSSFGCFKVTKQHCCKGRPGMCSCMHECPRPDGCTNPSLHCEHCSGRCIICACTVGCVRPPDIGCRPTKHCPHCLGLLNVCACLTCPRPYTAVCYGHCKHCSVVDNICECRVGCSRTSDKTFLSWRPSCKPPVKHCDHCDGQGVCVCSYGCIHWGVNCIANTVMARVVHHVHVQWDVP